jgi:hypothetical protein
MSTTTNFKRVALVAVAALGLGVLSSVPAQAVINAPAIAVTNGTAALGSGTDTATAAIISVTGLATVGSGDSITVTFINKGVQPNTSSVPRMQLLDTNTATAPNAATLVLDTISAVVANTTAKVTGSGSADSITASGNAFAITSIGTAGYVGARFIVQLESTTAGLGTAGVFNYTAIVTTYSVATLTTTVTADFTITIAALASASKVASVLYSTAYIGDGTSDGADEALSVDATASNTAVGYLNVTLKNASNVAVAQESVTITTTAGLVGNSTTKGKSVVLVNAAGTNNYEIYADGTAGVGVITISTPSVTFATKSITFYATAAKTITATVGTPLLGVGANAGAVRGVAVDANGISWQGAAYLVASSAADALIAGSATTPTACSYVAANARHECAITAIAAGTAKFKIIDAETVALATATSNEITVTVSIATVKSVKIEFDKATYAPNERATIYVTPLDAAGKAMQSVAYTSLFTSTGISVNGALSYSGSTTTADSLTAVATLTTQAQTSATTRARAGSQQFTVYMPAAGGTVTLTATGGTTLPLAAQTANAITASATVTDSGAAALAAVTALATTVASLKTLITTLTNLVLKIQKKVKA